MHTGSIHRTEHGTAGPRRASTCADRTELDADAHLLLADLPPRVYARGGDELAAVGTTRHRALVLLT